MMPKATSWRTSRWRIRPAVMLICAFLWTMMWSSFNPVTLISGALLGWIVGVVFPLPPMFWKGRLSIIGAAWLVIKLFWDLTMSSFMLLKFTFQRKVDLKAALLRVDLVTDNDLYQVGVASMISLVPGTVVVEVVRHPRRLYLHCVDIGDEEAVEGIQTMTTSVEWRLVNALGSKQERQDFKKYLATPSVPPPTDWAAEEATADEEINR